MTLRRTLIAAAVLLLGVFLLVPLAFIIAQALRDGVAAYASAVAAPDTRSAIGLTLLVTAIAVPLTVAFGIAAAWTVTKFEFRGKALLVTLIDLPFAVSPVIAGLALVLVFGRHGWLGPWLDARHLRVIFGVPGIVVATLFVTVPFVARELIPVMQSHGTEAEEAAVLLGASGWQTFWRVTLPSARWGVLYGTLLCAARSIGEFGAVSVVSGHIRGVTNTVPLHVEVLYDDYRLQAAFAVSSLLMLIAIVTLVAEHLVQARIR